jgi:hypothetical protein
MPISEEGREALGEEAKPALAGEDPAREGYVNELLREPSRPLTDEEEDAAKADPGRPERVYAPASARVPKEPAPGDDEFIRDDM